MAKATTTVTKKELVERISGGTDQTQVNAKRIIQAFLDAIVEELSRGHRLEFREFGVFEVKLRRARRARNPRTGERVPVPEKAVVTFKAGRLMRERVQAVVQSLMEDEISPPEPPSPPGHRPLR